LSAHTTQPAKRVLDPPERMSEMLFGLIMVLSFTCSLSAATAGREEVRTILLAALGCNLAWGIVDAIMYTMNGFIERSHLLDVARDIRAANDGARRGASSSRMCRPRWRPSSMTARGTGSART